MHYEIRVWDNNEGLSAQGWWCYEARVFYPGGSPTSLGSGSGSSESTARDCALRMVVHHKNKAKATWEKVLGA